MYTGKKEATSQGVPKLYDLCVRNLIENIDVLPQRIYLYSKGINLAFFKHYLNV